MQNSASQGLGQVWDLGLGFDGPHKKDFKVTIDGLKSSIEGFRSWTVGYATRFLEFAAILVHGCLCVSS